MSERPPPKLRWGILGTGTIASTFARGLAASNTAKLVAVGSRNEETASRFAAKHGVPRAHGSYESLLAADSVDVIYIATPHSMHPEWSIKTAEAGKHILCEKPLALNYAEATAVVEAARAHNVFLMEAFMYRCHPQIIRLVDLIRQGTIGEIRVIQATFGFSADFDPEARLFNQAYGGGSILDVGCYCASMARLIAGVARGRDFDEPMEVKGTAHIGDSRVDEWAVASLKFTEGIVAELATGIRVQQENVVRIYGSEGWLLLPDPWIPAKNSEIIVRRGDDPTEEILVESDRGLYTLEADTVAEHIENRHAPSPAMTWEDTLGNMRTLDRWRESIGLTYDLERPGTRNLTAAGRPLTHHEHTPMEFGTIEGLHLQVSRLVMGCDNQTAMPHAEVMFDHYFEHGGNAFDTAHIYGRGTPERLLGHWLKSRGVRDQVVIIAKAAHTPYNRPERLRPQLEESLDRMQTDRADILLAHRDNLEVPVAEWADAFNELLDGGLIRAYGGSNWTLRRVDEIDAYALSKGITPMAAVSNNFSLARMVSPVWDGCLSSSDQESRRWFERTQISLLAWSSQGRGFFTDRAAPGDQSDPELVRCWYADDNFVRQKRARELAAERGVAPINIALAYVLSQPFPTFALIGPRTPTETAISLEAFNLDLSREKMRWLNLQD